MGIYRHAFEIFGVKVGIETNRKYLLEDIKAELHILFPFKESEINFEESNRRFSIKHLGKENFKLEIDGEVDNVGTLRKRCVLFFLSQLRIKVAEYAESRVFLHAGVVGWKGLAIIIPANSFSGKTTLVKELVKLGADYYSDEYAVLDKDGFVHPFPKMLSLRGIIDEYVQKDIAAEEFGTVGSEPIPVGLVLITEYVENAKFQPEQLSVGQGVLEIIPHTLPIRYRPEFSLAVLNKILSRAIILKSQRSEAPQFAKVLTEYFDRNLKN